MYHMTIRLQTEGNICLYEQIYNHIKSEMKEGKLLAGERLPSTRSLAEFLGVARSTVDTAYGQLLDEGYIEAIPCKGYFVCSIDTLADFARGEQDADYRADDLSEQRLAETEEGIRSTEEAGEKETARETEVDFSPYSISMDGFPFDTWRRISKHVLSEDNRRLFSRGEPQGDRELRETISRYLHSSRGVNCRPEQIIVGAGNDYLLMLLEKILGSGVKVAMENPTYLRSYRIFSSFAEEICILETDENGMRPNELKATDANVVYVMPTHQFPSGTIMPIGRRNELLKWAGKAENRYIIEDDYDSEFRYRGKPIPALQSLDEKGKVIYLGSFSKSIAPSIRVSFMVLPEELLRKYKSDCYFYSCTVSRIDQSILNEFVRDGYLERHLNKMRKIYREKHDLLLDLLQPFEKTFRIRGENAGLHLVLESGELTEEELVERAKEKGVRVYGLSDYRIGARRKSRSILLGFGALESEAIEEGIKRLAEAWNIE